MMMGFYYAMCILFGNVGLKHINLLYISKWSWGNVRTMANTLMIINTFLKNQLIKFEMHCFSHSKVLMTHVYDSSGLEMFLCYPTSVKV
jgi:hypothetical protein